MKGYNSATLPCAFHKHVKVSQPIQSTYTGHRGPQARAECQNESVPMTERDRKAHALVAAGTALLYLASSAAPAAAAAELVSSRYGDYHLPVIYALHLWHT